MMAAKLLTSNKARDDESAICPWSIEAIGPSPLNTDYTKIVLGKKNYITQQNRPPSGTS